MKIKFKLLPFILPLTFIQPVFADDDFTFGVGFGSLYSGVGVNVGLKSETDLKYLSVGCVSYSSLSGEACGAGIGWVKTDLFEGQTNKHGASLYLGIVGSSNNYFNNDPVYGLGVGYHYFFNGIGDSGTNLGLTFVAGDDDGGTKTAVMLQLGYQF